MQSAKDLAALEQFDAVGANHPPKNATDAHRLGIDITLHTRRFGQNDVDGRLEPPAIYNPINANAGIAAQVTRKRCARADNDLNRICLRSLQSPKHHALLTLPTKPSPSAPACRRIYMRRFTQIH